MIVRPLAMLATATALLAGAAPVARAQAPAPAAGADVARARSLFDAGARAYDSGQFEAAIQAFEEAYAITPRDGLLFSLAQANRKQHAIGRDPRHLRAAVDHYREYLARVKEGGRRKDAAEALEQLEPLLGAAVGSSSPPPAPAKRATIVQISSSTPGATVSIDGATPAPAPLTREVPPGVHEVRLSAPGFHDEVQKVEALAGQFQPFTYPLRERPARLAVRGADGADVSVDGRFVGTLPLAPVELASGRHFVTVEANGRRTAGTDLVLARGETRALDVDLESTSQRDASWVVMISGVAIMAAGGAFGVVALAREGDAQDVLARADASNIGTTDVDAYESARADRDTFATASIATLAGGGLVTLVGIGLFTFDAPDPVAQPRLDDGPAAPGEPTAPPPAGGPTLELGFVPAIGPDGAAGTLLGRF